MYVSPNCSFGDKIFPELRHLSLPLQHLLTSKPDKGKPLLIGKISKDGYASKAQQELFKHCIRIPTVYEKLDYEKET